MAIQSFNDNDYYHTRDASAARMPVEHDVLLFALYQTKKPRLTKGQTGLFKII
ncbi:hypothetical protein ACVWYF_002685 [Hymenobacter sp. UYAg731]